MLGHVQAYKKRIVSVEIVFHILHLTPISCITCHLASKASVDLPLYQKVKLVILFLFALPWGGGRGRRWFPWGFHFTV